MNKKNISQWTPKMLSERTGVSISTLHFYEEKGLIIARRTSSNQRRYDNAMIRRIAFVKAGQKVGITLAEIKNALDELPQSRTPNKKDWQKISVQWQEMLSNRIKKIEQLRDNMTGCVCCGCLSLETCSLYNPDDIHAHSNALEK